MSVIDIDVLRIGSYFLGSGGGLEFEISRLMLRNQFKARPAKIVSLDSLKSDDLVVSISYMGCPAIEVEKTYNFSHLGKLIEKIEHTFQKKINAFAMWGVAGGGPFLPICCSSLFDIPILDADFTGRCFPDLQMLSTNLAGIPPGKSLITNVMGDMFEIECKTFRALERHARRLTMSSGGSCMIAPQVLTGEEAKRALIPGTLTQAMTIGKIIQETRDLNAVVEYTKGKLVGVGGVVLCTGLGLPYPFKKRIVIRDALKERTWEIWMANEFNLLFENGEMIAEVPDIITLCDPETCEPLTVGQMYLHANVAICTMPAPNVWYSEKGLALVRTKDHQDGKINLCGPGSSSLKRTA